MAQTGTQEKKKQEAFTANGIGALKAALAQSEGFRMIHSRLLHLLDRDDEEEDQVMPTSHACNTALSLLLDTQTHLNDLPRANVTIDETGGIRVQWISPERQVRLAIPAHNEGRQYVYFETASDYDLEDNPSPAALAQHLRWFLEQA